MMTRHVARVLVALLISSSSLSPSPLQAQGQTPVRMGWGLAPDGSVKIFNYVGKIRVVGWALDSVAVEGTVAPRLRMFGGGTRAAVKLGPDGDQRGPGDAAELTVRVPAGANVWVRGAATDIEIEGLIGTIDVGSVSGSVTVRGSPQAITAETMDGHLTVRGAPGTLRAKTATGLLEFTGAVRDATISTVSGEVRVSAGPLGALRIESVAGNVSVDGLMQTDGHVTVETHSGNIEVRVPKQSMSKVWMRSFRGTARVMPR